MPLTPEDFYLENSPSSLQQGDIANGVPLILLPALDRLVLIRSPHRNFFSDHLGPGAVNLVDELVPSDAFDYGFEYAAVAVTRGLAMLVTPTCDLTSIAESGGTWIVWPIRSLKDCPTPIDKSGLIAGRYQNLYALPQHRNFEECFVDVTDVRSVRPAHFPAGNRVASTTRLAQDEMLEKCSAALGRVWGYAEGEKIEARAKHETGRYRCARCNSYDITLPDPTPLNEVDSAPLCENCAKIGKGAQWYPLRKHHRKS